LDGSLFRKKHPSKQSPHHWLAPGELPVEAQFTEF
jgi:hypothetical protein